MLTLIKLLLPALIPSWRFFDSVGPSPRLEYAFPQRPDDWREFRPRPAVLTLPGMMRRLFWNPERNESLYLTSCAERLLETPTAHSVGEIEARLAVLGPVRWRLALVQRQGARLVKAVAYTPPA